MTTQVRQRITDGARSLRSSEHMASRLSEGGLALADLFWKEEGKTGIDAYEFASWRHGEAVAVKMRRMMIATLYFLK